MPRIARGLWVSILAPILVALISFIAIAAWDHYHSQPTTTQVRFFTPAHGIPLSRDKGSCFADFSIADYGAPEAHRCFSKREIYDPCFNDAGDGLSNTLMCVTSPWTPGLVRLQVTQWTVDQPKTFKVLTFPPNGAKLYKYLRRSALNTRENLPWALDLGGGLHCIFATGATGFVRGLRQNYICSHGDFTKKGWWKNSGWVVGAPNRRNALWQVIYSPPSGESTRQLAVATAWY